MFSQLRLSNAGAPQQSHCLLACLLDMFSFSDHSECESPKQISSLGTSQTSPYDTNDLRATKTPPPPTTLTLWKSCVLS